MKLEKLKAQLKSKMVPAPAFGDDIEIEVSQLSVGASIRLRELMDAFTADDGQVDLNRFVIASLMCSMKNPDGGYLVPEDDRVDELLHGLTKETVDDLWDAHKEMNPGRTETLDSKKKKS